MSDTPPLVSVLQVDIPMVGVDQGVGDDDVIGGSSSGGSLESLSESAISEAGGGGDGGSILGMEHFGQAAAAAPVHPQHEIRSWAISHCGEMLQDARLPIFSQFNRLASFRYCPISGTKKMEFATKGWYCSGVRHELRCVYCWRQMGPCHAFSHAFGVELAAARHHQCDGRPTQPDGTNAAQGFPAATDLRQDRLEYCISAPATKLRHMTCYASRYISYCNPYWPTHLWGMASTLAVAGFYYKRKCNLPIFLPFSLFTLSSSGLGRAIHHGDKQ